MDPKFLETLAREKGFEYRLFCSFGSLDENCTNEAVGDIGVNLEDQTVMLPICEEHLKRLDN